MGLVDDDWREHQGASPAVEVGLLAHWIHFLWTKTSTSLREDHWVEEEEVHFVEGEG